ncbi:hypothetical protein F5B22DRAFT_586603 [Xylaria bambusicola]|uniref:uncharacterized protein n=1 Tax=Xylaria bambusicola TaxID=326684 RepID=UPI002008802A|nr:uncharacterized protein F5B22DRAFT_586603 [Xylaria bambusicola]KAI0526599.1 hypothetical protein F5B22DRAFT_586603 [Xylaria bambusicola]
MSLFLGEARHRPRGLAHKIEEPLQPWTTARCQRLLRPLVSRITSLKRDSPIAGQPVASTARSASDSAAVSLPRRNRQREEVDSESGWLMPRKKRPRLTYSQRRSSQPHPSQPLGFDQSHLRQGNQDETSSLAIGTKPGVRKAFKCVQPERQQKTAAPGEVVPSTPILRRARGKIARSPVAPLHEHELGANQGEHGRERRTRISSSAQKRMDERLANLRTRFCSQYADLEAIYRSLEALLKATMTSALGDTSVRNGPRSLLDMCLRKVPEYIRELDVWERLDAEQTGKISTLDDINTSADIYNELESLGTNVGWKHLRVVVKADGLSAVKCAIEEGIFNDEFSQLLIDLCVQMGAASEAEDLMAALVDRQYPQPISTESRFTQISALQPLVMLNAFASQTQRTSFLFQQYSTLLSSDKLPVEWLATLEFDSVWSLAMQTLADGQSSCDAISFVTESILLLGYKKRKMPRNFDRIQLEHDTAKANHRTLMSVTSILASMSLLAETGIVPPGLSDSDTRRIRGIDNRFKYALRLCINGLESHMRDRNTQRLETLYLALFLSSSHNRDEKIDSHVRGNMNKLSLSSATSVTTKDIYMHNRYDNIAQLIASIARACGRATSVASHQCLHGLFGRLESLKLAPNLLDKLKAATAFLVAQQTNNVKDLIYAESLYPYTQPSPSGRGQHQSGSALFTGYRWEETIGEWVTVSPVMNKRRPTIMKSCSRSSNPATGMERSSIRSSNPTSHATDKLPDTETSPKQGTYGSKCDTSERTRPICDEQSIIMTRKRPRHIRSAETLPTRRVSEVLLPQQSHAFSASPKTLGSEIDSEKENRVRLLAKKPRRSSGRMVLGARSASRHSIGRRDAYSDDELCT